MGYTLTRTRDCGWAVCLSCHYHSTLPAFLLRPPAFDLTYAVNTSAYSRVGSNERWNASLLRHHHVRVVRCQVSKSNPNECRFRLDITRSNCLSPRALHATKISTHSGTSSDSPSGNDARGTAQQTRMCWLAPPKSFASRFPHKQTFQRQRNRRMHSNCVRLAPNLTQPDPYPTRASGSHRIKRAARPVAQKRCRRPPREDRGSKKLS